MHVPLRPGVRRAAVAAAAVGILVLTALAIRADGSSTRANTWLTALDVLVGLAFVVSGAASPGPTAEGCLVVAVGVAWLTGSVLTVSSSWHQAALMVTVALFPSGLLRGIGRWIVVAAAIPVALRVVPQWAVAVVFALVAVLVAIRDRHDPAIAWYPVFSATAVSATLAASHLSAVLLSVEASSSGVDPGATLVAYEFVLISIAVAYPFGARTATLAGRRLANRLVAPDRTDGVESLSELLRDVLGDPSLALSVWEDARGTYLDAKGDQVRSGERPPGREIGGWLAIDNAGAPLAGLSYRSADLEDLPTAAAVTSAVRLVITQTRLQRERQHQLHDLEAARARIVAAADRQRARVAEILRIDVDAPLALATSAAREVQGRVISGDARAALDIATQEMRCAAEDIANLVGGIAPRRLGDGRLRQALEELAVRSPVPVTVMVDAGACGDQDAETTLFYVCSEALVNVVKHATAKQVSFTIRLSGDDLVAVVSDDGCGGADPTGSGLQGLADRLAARRGRLRLESPPGAGTVLTATTPR